MSDATNRSRGVEAIAAERCRQVEDCEWPPRHDREHHGKGELVTFAVGVLSHVRRPSVEDADWIRPAINKVVRDGDRRNMLAVAGALIAAELDRMEPEPADDATNTADRAVRLPEPDEDGRRTFGDGSYIQRSVGGQGQFIAKDGDGKWLREGEEGSLRRFPSPEAAALALAALGQGPAVETPEAGTLGDYEFRVVLNRLRENAARPNNRVPIAPTDLAALVSAYDAKAAEVDRVTRQHESLAQSVDDTIAGLETRIADAVARAERAEAERAEAVRLHHNAATLGKAAAKRVDELEREVAELRAKLGQLDAGKAKAEQDRDESAELATGEAMFNALNAVRCEAFEAGFIVGNTFGKSMVDLLAAARGAKGGASL